MADEKLNSLLSVIPKRTFGLAVAATQALDPLPYRASA